MLTTLLLGVSLAADERAVQTILPTLGQLGLVIQKVEDEGYQITDMSLGLIFEERTASMSVKLQADEGVILVGLGDQRRLADLDMAVFDELGGLMASDELPDTMPVIIFTAPRAGVYDARVRIARTEAAYRGGFYAMVQGRPTEERVVSVADTWAEMMDAVELLERDGYQVLRSEWQTLAVNERGTVRFEMPEAASACTALVLGSSARSRSLALSVLDPSKAQVGEDGAHGQRAVVTFASGGPGNYELVMHARQLRRRASETHAVATVACRVGDPAGGR